MWGGGGGGTRVGGEVGERLRIVGAACKSCNDERCTCSPSVEMPRVDVIMRELGSSVLRRFYYLQQSEGRTTS